jgi:hypothetical protein
MGRTAKNLFTCTKMLSTATPPSFCEKMESLFLNYLSARETADQVPLSLWAFLPNYNLTRATDAAS